MRSEAVTSRERFAKQLLDLVTAFSEEQVGKMETTVSTLGRANDKASTSITESTVQLNASWEAVQADQSHINQYLESGLLDAEQRQVDNAEVMDL